MRTYEISLAIDYKGTIDRLCDYCYREFSDGTIISRSGAFFIDVAREAPSLQDAIQSVLNSAQTIGITIKEMHFDQLPLHEVCHAVVGANIYYKGTNGNEYDKENHGKSVEGKGQCMTCHDSHGLCIMVKVDYGPEICVDPTKVVILL